MIIKYKNYKLVPDDGRFNLEETVIATKKDSTDTYEKENNLGYGFSLGNAIKKMIALELAKDESVVSLNTYLEKYEEIYNLIKNELND